MARYLEFAPEPEKVPILLDVVSRDAAPVFVAKRWARILGFQLRPVTEATGRSTCGGPFDSILQGGESLTSHPVVVAYPVPDQGRCYGERNRPERNAPR